MINDTKPLNTNLTAPLHDSVYKSTTNKGPNPPSIQSGYNLFCCGNLIDWILNCLMGESD